MFSVCEWEAEVTEVAVSLIYYLASPCRILHSPETSPERKPWHQQPDVWEFPCWVEPWEVPTCLVFYCIYSHAHKGHHFAVICMSVWVSDKQSCPQGMIKNLNLNLKNWARFNRIIVATNVLTPHCGHLCGTTSAISGAQLLGSALFHS